MWRTLLRLVALVRAPRAGAYECGGWCVSEYADVEANCDQREQCWGCAECAQFHDADFKWWDRHNYYGDRSCLLWGIQESDHPTWDGHPQYVAHCSIERPVCGGRDCNPLPRGNWWDPMAFWCGKNEEPTKTSTGMWSMMVDDDLITQCCDHNQMIHDVPGCPRVDLPPSPPKPPPPPPNLPPSPSPQPPPSPLPPAPSPKPPPPPAPAEWWMRPPPLPSSIKIANYLSRLPRLPPFPPPRPPAAPPPPSPPRTPPIDYASIGGRGAFYDFAGASAHGGGDVAVNDASNITWGIVIGIGAYLVYRRMRGRWVSTGQALARCLRWLRQKLWAKCARRVGCTRRGRVGTRLASLDSATEELGEAGTLADGAAETADDTVVAGEDGSGCPRLAAGRHPQIRACWRRCSRDTAPLGPGVGAGQQVARDEPSGSGRNGNDSNSCDDDGSEDDDRSDGDTDSRDGDGSDDGDESNERRSGDDGSSGDKGNSRGRQGAASRSATGAVHRASSKGSEKGGSCVAHWVQRSVPAAAADGDARGRETSKAGAHGGVRDPPSGTELAACSRTRMSS